MVKITLKYFFILLLISSCDVINPPEEIPSYLEISPFIVEGINDLPPSADISDVWVSVNNEIIGVYTYDGEPILIPVLQTGEANILLRPGILKDVGFNNIHEIYPYYNSYSEKVNLLPGEATSLQPRTAYSDDASFVNEVTDDFETGLVRKYSACLGCVINLQTINLDSNNTGLFEEKNGTSIGLLEINQGSKDSINIRTSSSFAIPVSATQVWLEFDYKSNIIFTAGIEINNQFYFRITPFLVANPNGWKKVYLSLVDDFSIAPGQSFNLIFSSPSSDGLDDYYLAIDNIRIVVPQN